MGEVLPRIGGFLHRELAARHWVVTTGELLDRGITARQIEGLVARGVLHRVHRGVYAVGRPDLSFEGRCRAAVLACGPGSATSHNSSGGLWKFARPWGPIHVSAPRNAGCRHPGISVHRPVDLAADVTERNGIPRTSVARTILDMCPRADLRTVGRWIHEAGVQGVLVRRELWDVLDRHPHHRGARVLEAALAEEFAATRSGLEELMLDVIGQAGLPVPLVNHEFWGGWRMEEIDFAWPGLGMMVEVDGGGPHWSRWRRRQDAAKTERFRALGWLVERVPELQVTLQPASVVVLLQRLADHGRRNPPPRWMTSPAERI